VTLVRGADISRFQTVTDWQALNRALDFVIIKATEGATGLSPTFGPYWRGAHSIKVGLAVGSYHYGHPATSAVRQAGHYVTELRAVGWRSRRDLPPVLDIEETEGRGPATLTRWCLDFCREVDRLLGLTEPWLRCGVYTNRDYYTHRFDGPAVHAGRWLWLASWPNRDGPWPAESAMPAGAAIWQWTDRAHPGGIDGNDNVDADVARLADLRRLAPDHFPPEDTDMTTDASVRAIVRDELHRFLVTPDKALENLDNPGSLYSLAKAIQNMENDQDADRKEARAFRLGVQKALTELHAAIKADTPR
jgi:GH25 family lysozyme M1 (1,4-beta-N-acetylmuramidase)